MYKYRKEQVLDPGFLTKLVRKFKAEQVPRFGKCQAYYEVRTDIEKRTMKDGKPNNKLAHGFCRYITNMATSYFAGKPVRYTAEDPEYDTALEEVFKDNYIDSLNFNVSKEASKKGIGFMLIFINEKGKLRVKKLDAGEVIPVYSPSLDEFLEAAVRVWAEYDIDGKLEAEYADVYDEEYIHHFRCGSGGDVYQEHMPPDRHLLNDIPVIVVWNNEDRIGDFEPVISLNDAYDNAQSNTANDSDYFTDAYLCVVGASEIVEDALCGDDSDDVSKSVKALRDNRVLFLDDNGQAQWLVKQVNDAANENYKNRLYKDIFFLSQVPALSDENFAGNLSGVAIKYKLIGLEELAIMKESCFRSAQTKMVSVITGYLNLIKNKEWDPDTVKQKYDRNFTENLAEMIENATKLEGVVSHETQLGMLPADIVGDVSEELEKIRNETLEAENLPKAGMDNL
ncbi:MAG: phage portal protein [Lachnospiraceae bacterium]|nr:phage portal protein [Lachnospiraceae bacterium]